jgi:hypothetical protein
MINPMPATAERPRGDNFHPEFGRIIEKIKRRGSESLTDQERMMVVEIFRAAAMTREKRIVEAKEAIQKAHLSYCWRLTAS